MGKESDEDGDISPDNLSAFEDVPLRASSYEGVRPATHLAQDADETLGRIRERGRVDDRLENLKRRNRLLVVWSMIIVAVVLGVTLWQGDALFGTESTDGQTGLDLIPFLLCFVGVSIFVLNTALKKGEHWDFRKYAGEHAFRIAQAFGYLFVVWWAWATVVTDGTANSELNGNNLSPNIIGFLVGLFILRVERAMEGLGEKFEEALKAILPRAIAYETAEERRRFQLRGMYRMEDIVAQWEVLRPQVDDLGAREKIDEAIDLALHEANAKDPERARAAVADVARLFEQVKRTAGETLVPLDHLLPDFSGTAGAGGSPSSFPQGAIDD